MSAHNYRNSFPVVNGEMVCQGHADACAEFGHATYKIDGVDQGYCPRCNEVTAPAAATAAPYLITDILTDVPLSVELGTTASEARKAYAARFNGAVDTLDLEATPLPRAATRVQHFALGTLPTLDAWAAALSGIKRGTEWVLVEGWPTGARTYSLHFCLTPGAAHVASYRDQVATITTYRA